MAGCEGEVHMYSLFVDDAAQAGRQAVATACHVLAQGEPLPDQASQPRITKTLIAETFGCGICYDTAFQTWTICVACCCWQTTAVQAPLMHILFAFLPHWVKISYVACGLVKD